MIGKSNDETNVLPKSLLTNKQTSRLHKGFPNCSSANIKLSKSQLHKIPLGLTAEASATDAAIHKKIFRSGTVALMILNEEMNNIMKIVKSF